jgi:hypothetical protein
MIQRVPDESIIAQTKHGSKDPEMISKLSNGAQRHPDVPLNGPDY